MVWLILCWVFWYYVVYLLLFVFCYIIFVGEVEVNLFDLVGGKVVILGFIMVSMGSIIVGIIIVCFLFVCLI